MIMFFALSVANELKEFLSKEAYLILQMAVMRIQLNRKAISVLQNEYKYDLYPVKEGDKQKIFEYALVLQIKFLKDEWVDFVRGITPISIDLLYVILKKFCDININDFTIVKNDVRRWDEKKVIGSSIHHILEEAFNGKFRYGEVYSIHIEKLIMFLCKDQIMKDRVSKLVLVESKVRNTAAHEIVSVTDEWIYKRTNMHAKEIMQIIQYLCGEAGVVNNKDYWNSYDYFNKDIISLID